MTESDPDVLARIIDAEDFDPFDEISIGVMLDWLKRDGDLACPCSRYGRRTSDCAPWAVAMMLIYIDANGSHGMAPFTDSLEYNMGLVVNDSDGPQSLVLTHGGCLENIENVDVHYVLDEAADLARDDIERRVKDLPWHRLNDVIELLDGIGD